MPHSTPKIIKRSSSKTLGDSKIITRSSSKTLGDSKISSKTLGESTIIKRASSKNLDKSASSVSLENLLAQPSSFSRMLRKDSLAQPSSFSRLVRKDSFSKSKQKSIRNLRKSSTRSILVDRKNSIVSSSACLTDDAATPQEGGRASLTLSPPHGSRPSVSSSAACESEMSEHGTETDRRSSVRFSVDLADIMEISNRLTLQTDAEDAERQGAQKLLERSELTQRLVAKRRERRRSSGSGQRRTV